MEKILTSAVLWQDFDPAAEYLDANVLNVCETEEFVTKSVFFTGRKVADGETRVFAKVCSKMGRNSKQAVLLIDDYKKPINQEELQYWAANGFVAMAVDFVGRREKGAYTLYPQSLDYCNADVAKGYFEIGETVKESKIYEYALNCMRAVTYLLQVENAKSVSVITVKRGVRVGAIVLGTDARVTNGTVVLHSLNAEFPPYKENAKNVNDEWDGQELEERLAYEDRCQIWTTGLAPQTYAMQIKAPVYFVLSANSSEVDLAEANKMFYRLNNDSELLLLPLAVDCVPEEYMQSIVKWCKGGAVADDVVLKQYSCENGDNFVFVKSKLSASKLTLWYTRNVTERAKNWVSAPLKKTEEGYVAELDAYSANCGMLAFVSASGAVSCTTPLCELKVTKPSKVKIPTRSLYVGTGESNLVPTSTSDAWHGKQNNVEYTTGYLNIKGAKSKGIATFAINDTAVRRNENFTVSFDICCDVEQSIKVLAVADFGGENSVYSHTVKLGGDGKWQRITVDGNNFKTGEGRQMSEDADVQMLAFNAESEFIINNIFLV